MKSLPRQLKSRAVLVVLSLLVLISGCASTSGGGYSVGPRDGVGQGQNGKPIDLPTSELSVLIPILDPSIPENSADYEKEGIWPELRRAEANRFAVQLRDAVADTGVFGAVRVSPDDTATAHLYVTGKILESNGELIKIRIEVKDISGKRLLNKTYSYTATEYSLNDPRNPNGDLYLPVFKKAASEIGKLSKKLNAKKVTELSGIEEIRFAESFSRDYFSSYIKTRSGKTKLVGFPSNSDPMLKRVRALRVKDQMFMDTIQTDYDSFRNEMNEDYMTWQRQAYTESKAAREAQAQANMKMFVGILSVAAGAAIASNSNSSASAYGGSAVALAGVSAIASGVRDGKQAEAHRESLGELGRSLNIQLAPKVMKIEDRTVALTGTASEQFTVWRGFLREIYEVEKTPDTVL